ncbi:CAP domain-containing protein [Kitasatospora sp. NPDC006697]|uniref:CAP domain-containing protein n=1 Tax=Kitasatospora sp. NPDC006697 TaxID=3364020 RepID=UPI0036780257
MTEYASGADWSAEVRPAGRRSAGGAHRRGGNGQAGNGRHRSRRSSGLPGVKPLLAAVAVAATATSVVGFGGKLLPSAGRGGAGQDGRAQSAPEPPAGPGLPAGAIIGDPRAADSPAPTVSAVSSATAAPSRPSTGPTRLPGAGASTTPVRGATASAPPVGLAPAPSGSAPAPATSAPAQPAPASAGPTAGAGGSGGSGGSGGGAADVDAAADQVLTLINQARAAQGVAPLQMLAGLRVSADAHNHTMAAGCGLQHQCPGEPAFGARENAAGVQWGAAGENIGEGGPVANTTSAIASMAVGLTKSMLAEQPPNDGHRRNILDPNFHHIGIELLRDSAGTVWMTQDFSD